MKAFLCKIFGHRYTKLISLFQKLAECEWCGKHGWNSAAERRFRIPRKK